MSNTVLGVFALLTTLCFVALIVLQVMEHLFYGSPPSVWLPQ